MRSGKKLAAVAVGAVGLAIFFAVAFSSNLLLSPATANPTNPTIEKYADISVYTVYSIGNGGYGEQVLAKWQTAGLSKASTKTDILSEKAGGSKVVVLFSDSQMISEKKSDPVFRGKIQELRNSGTKLIMVSQNADDQAAFADLVGEKPQNVDFFGYKYFPAGSTCEMDGQKVSCGGVPVIKTGTYRNEDGSLDVNAMNEAILGFLAQAEV
jgi:hypothetical protein